MIWDGTITLGTLIQSIVLLIAIVVGWMKLDARLSAFAANLDHHAAAIEKHTKRLDAIDERLIVVVSDLQRLIGRSERVFRSGDDKQ